MNLYNLISINIIIKKGILIFLLSAIFFTFCGNVGDNDNQFPKKDVTESVCRPGSLKTSSGRNRVEISWGVMPDANIKSYKVYWNNRKDSISGNVPNDDPTDTIRLQLKNMEEGIYYFDVFHYDNDGRASVASTTFGQVYGDNYQKSLIQNKIRSLKRNNNDIIVDWVDVECTSLLIEYIDISGVLSEKLITKITDSDTIPNVRYGSEMKYSTGYLPARNCLDTFYTNYQSIDLDKKIQFAHPGIINDIARLDRLRMEGLVNEQLAAYENLKTFTLNNSVPTSFHSVVYVKASGSTPTETQFRRDPILAYAYALKWVRTGEPNDARHAIKILNGWASAFEKMDVAEGTQMVQSQLEAAWVIPTFAATAEILKCYHPNDKHHSDWYYSDILQFSDFLRTLVNYVEPMINDIDQQGRRYNNWGASAGYAKMAAGVFLDDKSIYDEGIRIVKKLIPEIIEPDGEVYELCGRDCGHPQYSMNALTYAAEIALVQSDESVYKSQFNRILTGWEWIVKAFTGQVSCRDCTGSFVHPGIEVAFNYYKNSVSPKSILFMESHRPFVPDNSTTFLGFTTLTHYEVN